MHFDLVNIIQTVGYLGLFAIVFAESGLLIGVFLPGDSLLFTAGILASQGYFNITLLLVVLFVAAVLGDNVGYAFGKRMGPRIFKKEDSILFHKKNLLRANAFFHKHGGKTLVLARFTPVLRTFAPILAGVGKMDYKRFFVYNLVGALAWAVGITLLGYVLGQKVEGIDRYIIPVAAIIILVSIMPQVWHLLRHKEDRQRLLDSLKKLFNHLLGKNR